MLIKDRFYEIHDVSRLELRTLIIVPLPPNHLSLMSLTFDLYSDLSFPLICSTMWLTVRCTAHCSSVTSSCLWLSSTFSLAKERPSSARSGSILKIKSSLPSCLYRVTVLRDLCVRVCLFCLFVYLSVSI